jgi:hypothetical protein
VEKVGSAGLYSRGEKFARAWLLLEKLEEVLNALLEPFWLRVRAWTQDLSWQGRTLLLVLAGLVALAAGYWKSLPVFYQTAVAFGKIVTSALRKFLWSLR